MAFAFATLHGGRTNVVDHAAARAVVPSGAEVNTNDRLALPCSSVGGHWGLGHRRGHAAYAVVRSAAILEWALAMDSA